MPLNSLENPESIPIQLVRLYWKGSHTKELYHRNNLTRKFFSQIK